MRGKVTPTMMIVSSQWIHKRAGQTSHILTPSVIRYAKTLHPSYTQTTTRASALQILNMTKTLPETPFILTGGCFCSAIRYSISVPSLTERPLIIPAQPEAPLLPTNKVTERLPMITLDHCTSCRRVAGALVESWCIIPQHWMHFRLLPRHADFSKSPDSVLTPSTAEYLTNKGLQNTSYVTHLQSSEESNRTFCGKCGTHLTFFHSGPPGEMSKRGGWGPYFDVSCGSLDRESLEREGFRPDRQVWGDDGIEWVVRLVNQGSRSLAE